MLCQIASWDEFWSGFLRNQVMGSLHNDDGDGDGDGNENGKKAICLDKQNNNFARASRFFVHFSVVVTRQQRETA